MLDNDNPAMRRRGGASGNEVSTKQKLMKTLAKFKKAKKGPTSTKGGMATVKIDF